MTSSYQDIYSIFLGLIKDYDFLKLNEDEAYEFMNEWLNGVFCRPKVRKLYSSILIDNDLQQIDYELKNSVDDQYDKNFTEFLCANGMVIGWLMPRVNNNQLLIDQFFGTKEANYFSQANHVTAIQNLYNSAYKVLDKDIVRDHGYAYLGMNGSLK